MLVSVTFHLMYVQVVLARSRLLTNHHLGKDLTQQMLTASPLCIMSICHFSYFQFWFSGRIWVLNATVPGHCLLVTFASIQD